MAPAFPSVDCYRGARCSFIGVNRNATIEVVKSFRKSGWGWLFASGFLEAQAEDEGGANFSKLLSAAGDMPIIGPNCYGFVNYLDGGRFGRISMGGDG